MTTDPLSSPRPFGKFGKFLGLGLTLGLATCTPTEPPAADGELGRGEFIYRCVGSTDTLCPDNAPNANSFPIALAVGGRFALEYAYNSNYRGDPLPLLRSGSQPRIADVDGIFQALIPGYTAILAVSGSSQVIDLKHFRVAAIDHLQIRADGIDVGATLTIPAGTPQTLEGAPFSAQEIALAGALPYRWSSADPTIAAIVGADNDDRVVIEGLHEGIVDLELTVGEAQRTIAIVVLPGESTTTGTDSDTTTGTDSDTTTGDESDTDSDTDGDTDTDTDTDGTTGG